MWLHARKRAYLRCIGGGKHCRASGVPYRRHSPHWMRIFPTEPWMNTLTTKSPQFGILRMYIYSVYILYSVCILRMFALLSDFHPSVGKYWNERLSEWKYEKSMSYQVTSSCFAFFQVIFLPNLCTPHVFAGSYFACRADIYISKPCNGLFVCVFLFASTSSPSWQDFINLHYNLLHIFALKSECGFSFCVFAATRLDKEVEVDQVIHEHYLCWDWALAYIHIQDYTGDWHTITNHVLLGCHILSKREKGCGGKPRSYIHKDIFTCRSSFSQAPLSRCEMGKIQTRGSFAMVSPPRAGAGIA